MTAFWKRFIGAEFLTSGGALLANIFQAVTYIVVLRIAPDKFAESTVLFSINIVFVIIQSTMGNYVTMLIKTGESLQSASRQARRLGWFFIAGTLICCFLFAGPIATFLRLESTFPLFLLALAGALGFFTSYISTILGLRGRFFALILSQLLNPLIQLLSLAGWVAMGYSFPGVAPFILIPAAFSLLFVYWLNQRDTSSNVVVDHVSPSPRNMLSDLLTITISTALLGLSLRFHFFWSKHLLSDKDAAVYSALTLPPLFLYYATNGLVMPAVTYFRASDRHRIIAFVYGMFAFAFLVSSIFFLTIGTPVLLVVFGPNVVGYTIPLILLFVASTGYSVIIFCFGLLNLMNRRIHLPLSIAFVLCNILVLYFFGVDILTLAEGQAVIMMVFGGLFTIALFSGAGKSLSVIPLSQSEGSRYTVA
jgi:hypothetical protein